MWARVKAQYRTSIYMDTLASEDAPQLIKNHFGQHVVPYILQVCLGRFHSDAIGARYPELIKFNSIGDFCHAVEKAVENIRNTKHCGSGARGFGVLAYPSNQVHADYVCSKLVSESSNKEEANYLEVPTSKQMEKGWHCSERCDFNRKGVERNSSDQLPYVDHICRSEDGPLSPGES